MVLKSPKTTLEILKYSVQMVSAPCYSEMQPVQLSSRFAGLIGKEIHPCGVPGHIPIHILSLPR